MTSAAHSCMRMEEPLPHPMALQTMAFLSIAPHPQILPLLHQPTEPSYYMPVQLCRISILHHLILCQMCPACCRDPGSPLSGEDGDPTSPPRPDFEPLAEDPHDEGRLGDQVVLLMTSPA